MEMDEMDEEEEMAAQDVSLSSAFTSDSTSLPLTPFYHLKNGHSNQRKQK